ncbi:MAG: hypothetical protein V4724_35945 [Pseudomonadota bacterium]
MSRRAIAGKMVDGGSACGSGALWTSLLLLVWLLAGCAAPVKQVTAAQAQAIELNRRGVESFEAGELARAQQLFEAALRLERAVENEEGIALNVLNLAQCLQRQGQPEQAARLLDTLLGEATLAYSAPRRTQAMMQQALLALQRKDVAQALLWQQRAGALCGSDCALAGKLLNLAARLALEQGDAARAGRDALAALARNRAAGDEVEVANALRLQGAAELALGRPAQARQVLLEALALDKDSAAGDKIYQDLLLLGHASDDTGQRRRYWQRALAVAQAAGRAQSVKEVEQLLAALPPGLAN